MTNRRIGTPLKLLHQVGTWLHNRLPAFFAYHPHTIAARLNRHMGSDATRNLVGLAFESLEPLEPRTLLSAIVDGGVLTVTGSEGNDVLEFTAGTPGQVILVGDPDGDDGTFDDITRIVVLAGDGDDRVTVGLGIVDDSSDAMAATLNGQGGDDVLIGGSGADQLIGGSGRDTLDGRDGSDTVDYSDASGKVSVRLRDDRDGKAKDGDRGKDVLRAIENITGSAFDDKIRGNSQSNRLEGGGLDDKIVGGGGDDIVDGGDGNNKIVTGDGDDSITTAGGNDTIKAGDGDNTIDAGAGNNKITTGNGVDTVTTGDGNDVIKTKGGDDRVVAGNGNNTVKGGDGHDWISAGTGADNIKGDDGDDLIDAGTGAGAVNSVNGGKGQDVLVANPEDKIIGGAAIDLFADGTDGRDYRVGQDIGGDGDSVTPGSFTDPSLFGTRTDLLPGAPDVAIADHTSGSIDYSDYSNPPSYGPHHPFDAGVVPIPTGVYTITQFDEDVVHNLEHGHVWIAYKSDAITSDDLTKLQLVVQTLGPGRGVVLTPRPTNDDTITLVSWARHQALDEFDLSAVLNFIATNRGHAPEGFITP